MSLGVLEVCCLLDEDLEADFPTRGGGPLI